ncbi:hypothetical protein F4009_06765 [Candidatus Poribacteria bacterium]|nr:hypothetical protein [Candidatus Poribacteria bacterium]MYH80927.1 hypothetical protein [Candidatus Poribacteria bacterium]MYK93691.1 hypothetical protein [Candidatus Poribacteria bacterium]
MPIQPVISNNSPLVGLLGINLLSLLRDLYTIDVIKPLLIRLQANGIHLSELLINNALQDADEAD